MVMIQKTSSILLVGFGNMGSALFRGWIDMALSNISILSPNTPDKGILTSCKDYYASPDDITSSFDVVILAVKPQIIERVCKDLASILRDNTLIISIAAGKTLDALSLYTSGKDRPIVRAMPNLPASISQGMTVCCASAYCSETQRNIAEDLMRGVGNTIWIEDEDNMHAVTALSGSGPAYLFLLLEGMIEAGVEQGLSLDISTNLARQTIIGSASLLEKSDLSAKQLRENVTSKGGTTEAALDVLMDQNKFTTLMKRAIKNAKERSQSL